MNELTQEKLKELLSYDPEIGFFIWKNSLGNKIKLGDMAGTKSGEGYIQIQIAGKRYKAHRLAWLYVYGNFPKHQIDHINSIKDDNRIENLRDVTTAVNGQNLKKAHGDSKTGLLGVSLQKHGKYRAGIRIAGKNRHLGLFGTPELAHAAYMMAKRKSHEGCTV